MLSSREAITANNHFLTLEIRRGKVETGWIMGGLITVTKEFVITSPKTRCLEANLQPTKGRSRPPAGWCYIYV
jgi:hypothetical protein